MRRGTLFVLSVLLVLVEAAVLQARPEPPGRRVLIGFKADGGPRTPNERAAMVRQGGGVVHGAFRLVPVVAAHVPEQALGRLNARPEIEYVEDDVVLYAVGQVKPWGVDRIDADLVWPTGNTGRGVKVAVLDTGVAYDHPDLSLAGGVNYAGTYEDGSTSPSVWADRHGHGTHVAGIIGARNNTLGVVGVAPDVSLWAVRVLGDDGSGYTSDVIQGLDWCAANGVHVAGMSLGGESTTSLESACDRAYSHGVLLVAAAGNGGGPVSYPAAYSSVIAVSATDSQDNPAPFSNRGPQIELAAPGVSIYSTYKAGSYARMSGTSIACPHVVATAALAWASGLGSNSAVRDRLTATAEDLGTPGFDYDFGYGLVDAQRAAGTGAAGGGTEEAPAIRIVEPQEGARVSGTIAVTAVVGRDTGTDQVEFFVDGVSVGLDADGGDGWSAAWDTAAFVDGEHTITAVAIDATGQAASHSVNVMVGNTAALEPTVAFVRSITYGTKGGRLGERHLLITLRIADDLGHPVANASVVAFVSRDGGVYQALADRTDSRGLARLRLVRAASGSYETRVESVAAAGLVWDGVTPVNGFSK